MALDQPIKQVGEGTGSVRKLGNARHLERIFLAGFFNQWTQLSGQAFFRTSVLLCSGLGTMIPNLVLLPS